MLLDLAEAMTPLLQARQERIQNGNPILRDGFDDEDMAETTLQILFFDGEEAFHDWSDTDSIYGARCVHLLSIPQSCDSQLTG
jgi:glutaminyl-peptide cyclotransferase